MAISYKDAYVKLQYRLNKSGTEDYANLDHDPATEAINKALNDWVRRTYQGNNLRKEGVEETRMRVDDLQPLLVPNKKLQISEGKIYSETLRIPLNYRYFSSLYFYHTIEGCSNTILIPSDLREEANAYVLLNTDGTKPSLQFEQCFHTIAGNKIRLYHNNEFTTSSVYLTYYRNPKVYDSRKPNELFDFKDDVVEVIIDEAAKIISGDTDNQLQFQRNNKSVEENT